MMRSIQTYRRRNKQRLKKSNHQPQNDDVRHPSTTILGELPQDLIFSEILTRLPVNSLTRFKTVSKTWNFIIKSPNFIKSHLKRTNSNPFVPTNCVLIKSAYYFYILNYSAYDGHPADNFNEKGLIKVNSLHYSDNGVNTFLIGSCNGLVCFGRGISSPEFDYYFRVYNPLTGRFREVLDPLGNFKGGLINGFGFVSCKDDYILFVGGLQRRSCENFVYVYSLRSNIWKKIGVFGVYEFWVVLGGRGVLVNETLHWDRTQVQTSNAKCICGFDLADETFKDLKMPRVFWGDESNDQLDVKLSEMDGSLCAWQEDMYGMVELWILKQYGMWDSWTKLFKIDTVLGFDNFCGCLKNGKVLVQTDSGSLLLFDPDQSPPCYFSLVKDLGDIEVVSYIQSPVSPFLECSDVAENKANYK